MVHIQLAHVIYCTEAENPALGFLSHFPPPLQNKPIVVLRSKSLRKLFSSYPLQAPPTLAYASPSDTNKPLGAAATPAANIAADPPLTTP